MHNFIVGLDEICIMRNAHGDLNIVAPADKKKHKKLLDDTRMSITIVCTSTVASVTGPTIFLMKGEKRKKAFTDEYLLRNVLAPGSTITTTENAYMTDEAWLQVSKYIVKGYCELP